MNAQRLSLWLIAFFGVSLMLIGVAYILQPVAVLGLTGGFQLDSSALTDARATYGGIQLGLGLYLLLALRNSEALRGLLLMLCAAFAAVGVTRLFGYFYDAPVSDLHFLAAVSELAFAALAAGLRHRLPT